MFYCFLVNKQLQSLSMTLLIIAQILLLALALSADAFAVSVTNGLTIKGINKKRIIFIALTYGIFQGLMPLIGYWLVELIGVLVGEDKSATAGYIMSTTVTWIAFALLIIVGTNMIIEGIKEMKKEEEEKTPKEFKIKDIIYLGIATSIDALGSGVALHAGLSNNITIWLHISIIIVITFILSLLGVTLGKQIEKLFKGKYEITTIIGGVILLLLAAYIVTSHYLGF